MSTKTSAISHGENIMIRQRKGANLSKRLRRVGATATALTFLCQNFAWALCADGSTFPATGYVNGQPPAANWSPGVFTGTAGSIFVPDKSIFENNDPTQPVTGAGHNWAFDQARPPARRPISAQQAERRRRGRFHRATRRIA